MYCSADIDSTYICLSVCGCCSLDLCFHVFTHYVLLNAPVRPLDVSFCMSYVGHDLYVGNCGYLCSCLFNCFSTCSRILSLLFASHFRPFLKNSRFSHTVQVVLCAAPTAVTNHIGDNIFFSGRAWFRTGWVHMLETKNSSLERTILGLFMECFGMMVVDFWQSLFGHRWGNHILEKSKAMQNACAVTVSFWLTKQLRELTAAHFHCVCDLKSSGLKSAPLMPCGIWYSQHARLATCLSHTSAVNPPKVLRYEGQHFLCWTNACPPKVKRLQISNVHDFFRWMHFCHFVGWVWWCLNGHMVQQFLCPANWQKTYSPTPNLGIHDVIMGDTYMFKKCTVGNVKVWTRSSWKRDFVQRSWYSGLGVLVGNIFSSNINRNLGSTLVQFG